jgi:hypothetical protein
LTCGAPEGAGKLWMVEQIKGISPELDIPTFCPSEAFEETEVNVDNPRVSKRIPSQISVGERSRHRKGRGVKPFLY